MKLRCLLRGDPSPTVHWLYNGQRIAKSAKYVLRRRSFLVVIREFSEEDAGKYTCVGTNSAGSVNMTYTVTAAKQPTAAPVSAAPVEKLSVTTGQNVTLTCEVPNAKVQYLLWNPPNKSTQTHKMAGGFRTGSIDRDVRRRKKMSLEKRNYVRDGLRVQESILVNVTKEMHEGVYKCVALFHNQMEIVTVKTIDVVVTTGTVFFTDFLKFLIFSFQILGLSTNLNFSLFMRSLVIIIIDIEILRTKRN